MGGSYVVREWQSCPMSSAWAFVTSCGRATVVLQMFVNGERYLVESISAVGSCVVTFKGTHTLVSAPCNIVSHVDTNHLGTQCCAGT